MCVCVCVCVCACARACVRAHLCLRVYVFVCICGTICPFAYLLAEIQTHKRNAIRNDETQRVTFRDKPLFKLQNNT